MNILTPAQRSKLTSIAFEDEQAKVISWSAVHEGPLVRLGNDDWVAVTPQGRRVPVLKGGFEE